MTRPCTSTLVSFGTASLSAFRMRRAGLAELSDKKPSTAELVDWISALLRSGISIEKVEAHIPFVGALLKKEQDIDALTQYGAKGGRYPKSWQELGPRYNQ